MRPKLKVSNITNLQDARYAAGGSIDFVSFSLARGSARKLSAAMVWNMVQWISGPEVILEMNAESLEELEDAKKSFSWRFLSFPMSEWKPELLAHTDAIILQTNVKDLKLAAAKTLLQTVEAEGKELKFEVIIDSVAQVKEIEELLPHCLLHFSNIDEAEAFGKSSETLYGITLGEEAEEAPGELDYYRVDDFLDAVLAEEWNQHTEA